MQNKNRPKWVERFQDKLGISISDPNGCWRWKDALDKGYGRFYHDGKTYRAHRISYELYIGKIPKGLTIDHLCKNKSCTNPKHLEPVSSKENTLRGNTAAAINSKKTHCIHGHEFTEDNTLRYKHKRGGTSRGCYECNRKRTLARYRKLKASKR